MKKILACLLSALILFVMTSCKTNTELPDLPDPPTKAELAERIGITETEIDQAHRAYPQDKTELDPDAVFAEGQVIIIVYPFANKYKYSPDDFAEIGCLSVKTIMEYRSDQADPSRILLLSFNGNVKNAVDVLWERADIYYAGPDYIVSGY